MGDIAEPHEACIFVLYNIHSYCYVCDSSPSEYPRHNLYYTIEPALHQNECNSMHIITMLI